jgi:hypothetical protein
MRHENAKIVTFAMPTNLFLARPNISFSLEKILSIAHLLPYSGSFGFFDL